MFSSRSPALAKLESIMYVALLLFGTLCWAAASAAKQLSEHDLAPMNQHLPDCSQPFKRIRSKSNVQIMLCPMIK